MIKKIFEKIQDISYTLRGIFKYEIYLKKSCYLPKNKVKEYQFKKLKSLLIESSKNVPYYKELFEQIQFNPEKDFNSLEDVKKIPILDKEILRANRDKFINHEFTKKALVFKTSGSSGNPFSALISIHHWIV